MIPGSLCFTRGLRLFVNQSLTVFSRECCEDEEAVNEGCDTPRPKENSSTVGPTGRTFPLDFFFSLCVRNKAGAQGPELGNALTQVRTQGLLN